MNSTRSIVRQLSLLTAALIALPCYALTKEPAAIRLGAISLTPTLQVTEAYDDNFREVAEQYEESSWITTIEPALELSAQERLNQYRLRYTAVSDIFHSSHDDDNTDHLLSADAHVEFTRRQQLDLNAGYARIENTADPRSTVENDKYGDGRLTATYGLGAESARMQIELAAGLERRRYHNTGSINKDKEHDTRTLAATAFYRLAPKTRALLELRSSNFEYVSFPSLDSINRTWFAGVTMDATAKTSGLLKVGRQKKDFKDPSEADPALTAWQADLTWKPRTYSTVALTARRGIDEGSIEEQFIETRMAGVEWRHRWNAFFTTGLAYINSERDFDSPDNRHDESDTYRFGLSWDVRRWLTLDLGYRYRKRTSNVDLKNFERNLYSASVNVSL